MHSSWVSAVTGIAATAFKLADGSSDPIVAWPWSFVARPAGTGRSPGCTYSSPGAWTFALTVNGPGGSNTATKSGYITVSAPASGGGSGVGTAGLVAAYDFEETTGTQAQDTSGKANHGALTDVTRSSSGKFGRALAFNGSNSLVTVSDSASLDLASAMTLSAWVYPTSWASGCKNLIMKEHSGGLAYTLNANSDAGQLNSTVRIGSTDRQLTAGSHLPSNTWTHLAATYDGTRQRLYINGTQVGSQSQTGSLEVSTNPLRIGDNTVWSGQYFQGLIDEVRIYNRALSQTEVAAVSKEPVVSAAPPASVCATRCTLWDNATTLSIAAKADYSAVEVGLKFRSDVAGQVTGVRFYKGNGNTGNHVGRLWSSSGQLLAQATSTSESASGWQQVAFATPVAIQTNTTYLLSYHAPAGRYAYDEGYFDAARTQGPLRAPSTTEATGNRVYRYGSGGGAFPTAPTARPTIGRMWCSRRLEQRRPGGGAGAPIGGHWNIVSCDGQRRSSCSATEPDISPEPLPRCSVL